MSAPLGVCPNASRACASRGCKDPACMEAKRRYNRRSSKLCRMGRSAMVDAGPVREHVRSLMAAGMGYRRVAVAAGMTHQGIQKIIGSGSRPAARVRRETAAAVLAVRVSRAPTEQVDVCGTRRRLQALVRVGWTQAQLAEASGIYQSEVGRLIRHAEYTSVRRAGQVEAVYERLSMTVPTGRVAERCRARARNLGWPSPLAWEYVDIDDPAAAPDVGRPRAKRPSRAVPVPGQGQQEAS